MVSTKLCDTHVTAERTERFRRSFGLTALLLVAIAAGQLLLAVAERFAAGAPSPRSPEELGRGGLGDVGADTVGMTARNSEDSSFF